MKHNGEQSQSCTAWDILQLNPVSGGPVINGATLSVLGYFNDFKYIQVNFVIHAALLQIWYSQELRTFLG